MTKKGAVDHLNYALVAKAHTQMYLMHKWWARKPHNVVSEYIKHYSAEGDIVLDPFVGSGVTALEAIKLGRKAVAIDLDPMATFITRNTGIIIDTKEIEKVFKNIELDCRREIEELYSTKCNKCSNIATILATIWNKEKAIPVELRCFCAKCNKRFAKKPDAEDLELLKKVERGQVPYWYPTTKLAYDGAEFLKREKSTSIPDLFTKRNLIALSILMNRIERIKEPKIRNLFLFAFTGISHLVSKMCPVAKAGGRGHWSELSATSFWPVQSYWIPPHFMESNVWMLFESKITFKQGIIVGKKDSNAQIAKFNEAKSFEELRNDANIMIKTHDALELSKIIPPNSVDYVFTDPPYGGAVQYFELSTLWASWLKMDLDYADEITINKQQEKDFDYYHKMLSAAFKQVYDVLKPSKYMTVTFHSTEIKVWTSIIKAIVRAGFDLEKIIYQPPARASAKGLLQPYGSAVGDYYLRFRKPEILRLQKEEQLDEQRYERIIVEAAKNIIAERGEPTPYTFILNGIIVELKKEGALLLGQKNPDDVMKKYVGTEFVLVSVPGANGQKAGKKWWLKDPASISYLEQIPLADRVEIAVVDVLHSKVKVSFDDVLQYVFIKFPNALTPETEEIQEILEEYAQKTTDGNWMLKSVVKGRESEHTKLIFYLAHLGKLAGFDVWVGQKEQGDIFNGERLGKLVTPKDPVWRFIPTHNLDRVKQIDVIWHDEGRVRYEFEVENTTAITEAIVRGSNIPHDHINRLIVIPEEREGLLFRKLKEPILQGRVTKDGWRFVFYHDIENYYEKCRKVKKVDVKDFEKLFKIPKETRQKQAELNSFISDKSVR